MTMTTQDEEPDTTLQSKLNDLLLLAGCLVLGGAMLLYPHLFDDVHVHGRRSLMKLIFKFVWGIPVGIIVIAIAGWLGYRFYADYIKRK